MLNMLFPTDLLFPLAVLTALCGSRQGSEDRLGHVDAITCSPRALTLVASPVRRHGNSQGLSDFAPLRDWAGSTSQSRNRIAPAPVSVPTSPLSPHSHSV
ncbi:hypothetical protein AAFF_G00002900 [Aldrovandia affinis]|uniref:Secreted protein n=1 Tax=Aldrovandia affinis TaxID=143900 RepID=A0AAD7TEU4_9TELE|nr:hypothetical protein AAFF_G00002900 [Aldrovandia affinis]